MKPVINDRTIALVGSWNVAILNPDWVSRTIFDGKQINVELNIEGTAVNLRYIHDDILMIPKTNRIVLGVRSAKPESAAVIEQVAEKILRELPVTPVTAAGINFGFVQTEVSAELANLFNIADAPALGEKNLIIKTRTIIRAIEHDNRILNLRLTQSEDGKVNFHFNFHKQVPNAAAAIEAVHGKSLQYDSFARQILADIYHIELEQEGVGPNV